MITIHSMEEDFLDSMHTQMLNDLGLIRKEGGNMYPSYWEVKRWLYENHKIWFEVTPYSKWFVISSVHGNEKEVNIIEGKHDSPIDAEIKGIRKVIQQLHKRGCTVN